MNLIDYIIKHKIVSIARRIYGEDLRRLGQSLCRGGIRLMELTFDQNDPRHLSKTAEGITLLRDIDGLLIGAGTVLSMDQLRTAADSGAKYIVSPNTDVRIIEATKKLGLVSIPGAATPTEILNAHQAGADFIKIFPALPLGVDYLKAICQPLNHLRFIANAGVAPENIRTFFDMGFVGAGISTYLNDPALIMQQNFDELERRAVHLLQQLE